MNKKNKDSLYLPQLTHLLGIEKLSPQDINFIIKKSQGWFEKNKNKPQKTDILRGKTQINLFFEPSTRTQSSFELAGKRLGADVINMSLKQSSVAKGETLIDTAVTLNAMKPDLLIIRHYSAGASELLSQKVDCSVINAGDGENEHPSQALLDLFTIKLELESKGKSIDGSNIALVGDLKFGRAVHSLCKALNLFENISFNLISPEQLKLPPEIRQDLVYNGMKINEFNSIESGIGDVDIIYVTRVQEERFDSPKEANKYKGLLKLNQNIYTENCEPNTVIMHPLPRDSRPDANELDTDMNENPNLAIYRQTDNGLLVRMALISLILGVDQTLSDYDEDISWVSSKKSN